MKHTLLVPRARPEAAVAEVWAIAFAEHGARKQAVKRSLPRSQLQSGTAPFHLRVSCAVRCETICDMHRLTQAALLAASKLCDRADCPGSLETLRASYCKPTPSDNSSVQANDCHAGQTFITTRGLSRMRFDFDGNGKLVAAESQDDVEYGTCELTHYIYGSLCQLTGEPKPACDARMSEGDAGI